MARKIRFNFLEKEYRHAAKEFALELEMLPVFLNYYRLVQGKWLKQIGLSNKQILKVLRVCGEYAKRKVALENKRLPQWRRQMVKIEDEIMSQMYEGRLLRIYADRPLRIAKRILAQEYPDAVILDRKQLAKLARFLLFDHRKRRVPTDFMVFDPKSKRIIGIEIVGERK